MPKAPAQSPADLAIDLAVRHFRRSRRDRHRVARARLIGKEDGRLLVIVYFGDRLPRGRALFAVSDATGEVTELSLAHAKRYQTHPWR
jgi:hypothetical protein